MKLALATLAFLFAIPSLGAQAQGMCQQEFAACMERCGVQDRCILTCQARNTACADAVWNKPKPSYENMKRPPDENETGAAAENATPAPARGQQAVRPERRPVTRQ